MAENQLTALERKIDELIALCEELSRENRQLKAQSADWQQERQNLIDKNEAARVKVEAMLGRLRAME
jgi:cell division protein ZapB